MVLSLKHIYAKLEKRHLDALIVSSPYNITYLTGFRSRDSYLLISKNKNIYFTDFRYIEEAARSLKGRCTIEKINGSVFEMIAAACNRLKIERVGFEERCLLFAEHKKIREELKKTTDLIPTHGLIEGLRQIKSEEELGKIIRAAEISIMAVKFIKNFISPGKRETEIAGELERFIRYNGAYASAFDIIVASGPNSSLPHHITSQRKIKNNEPVLVDIGVDYEGYKSDLTRIFFLGKINPTVIRIYDIVLAAQDSAIREIKPDVFINKVDTAARQYITQKGYGGFFGHSLGHGIGLEVHEEPHISQKENNKLKQGMVFTVEPAIYLPSKFGVRIEDMVLVTKKGCEVLSGALNK